MLTDGRATDYTRLRLCNFAFALPPNHRVSMESLSLSEILALEESFRVERTTKLDIGRDKDKMGEAVTAFANHYPPKNCPFISALGWMINPSSA